MISVYLYAALLEQEKAQLADRLKQVSADFAALGLELERVKREAAMRQEQDKLVLDAAGADIRSLKSQLEQALYGQVTVPVR